jgi:hypothetical protein
MLDRYTFGIASIILATVGTIVLIWAGFDNVLAWRIVGTGAVLLGGAWIVVASNSAAAVQVVGPPPPPDKENQVTYVLDRDLVRFLKFAGSVLASF